MTDFYEAVRGDIWKILSGKYNTVRHGGHPSDVGEYRHKRAFWPDMKFHEVEVVDAPTGWQLRITFTPANEPGPVYGYRIDVDKAAEAWKIRVGIHDPHSNPSMFAAELVWYMIAYIGSTRIDNCPDAGEGVRWINTGADVFKPLPDVLPAG